MLPERGEQHSPVTAKAWALKALLALVGCFAGAYVGQELLGGGALGWTVTGAIAAGFCQPLFSALFARNQSRAARRP